MPISFAITTILHRCILLLSSAGAPRLVLLSSRTRSNCLILVKVRHLLVWSILFSIHDAVGVTSVALYILTLGLLLPIRASLAAWQLWEPFTHVDFLLFTRSRAMTSSLRVLESKAIILCSSFSRSGFLLNLIPFWISTCIFHVILNGFDSFWSKCLKSFISSTLAILLNPVSYLDDLFENTLVKSEVFLSLGDVRDSILGKSHRAIRAKWL